MNYIAYSLLIESRWLGMLPVKFMGGQNAESLGLQGDEIFSGLTLAGYEIYDRVGWR